MVPYITRGISPYNVCDEYDTEAMKRMVVLLTIGIGVTVKSILAL